MGTKAETIRVSARPAGFTLWTAAVSALAAAALIMSAVALTVAARDRVATGVVGGTNETARTDATRWDAAKLEALESRMFAESLRIGGNAPIWDPGKLEALESRMFAESLRIDGNVPIWDAAKLEALEGRVRAG